MSDHSKLVTKDTIADYLATLPRTDAAAREIAAERGHGHVLRPLEALRLLLKKAVHNRLSPSAGDPALFDRGVYLRMSEPAAKEIWAAAQLEGTFEEWLAGVERVDLRPYKGEKR